MDKLEMIESMKKLEEKRKRIKDNIKAIKSSYFIDGFMNITIMTDDFEKKGNNDNIFFDKEMMIEYLEKEQKEIKAEMNKAIINLSDEIEKDSKKEGMEDNLKKEGMEDDFFNPF